MAAVAEEPGYFEAVIRSGLDTSQQLKTRIAAYRGATCGVRYCEALQAVNKHPLDIL